MRALSPSVLRELRDLLRCVIEDCGDPAHSHRSTDATRMLEKVDFALTPKRSAKPAKARREKKKSARMEEWEGIRAQVLARAADCCENQACSSYGSFDVDHMFGGFGRRVSLQSKFTCWALCHVCHRRKTENSPSAAYWLKGFIQHCQRQCLSADAVLRRGYAHTASVARARLETLELKAKQGVGT